MKGKRKRLAAVLIILAAVGLLSWGVAILYRYNYIPHKTYVSEHFGITPYVSVVDKDGDQTDDQTDILQSARDYIQTNPQYKSKYYGTGYPDDEYGVCTDVVAYALLGAGYDLMELVNEDILSHPDAYGITEPDKNIDFRRVRNLKIFFKNTTNSLTTDVYDIEAWQGGDIVIFENHIGIVSDKRNKDGIPFVIHNANPIQADYEEDILETWGRIVGHYRVS